MSGYDRGTVVNSTSVQVDVPRPRLTNGQIAAITIGTTFVFFLTMMMAVCAGEYWKYLHGTKRRPHIRRQRHSTTARSPAKDELGTKLPDSPNIPETSVSQSDFLSSADSSGDSSHRHHHSSAVEGTNTSILYDESFVHGNIIRTELDERLETVNLDCAEGCEEPGTKSDEDVSMVPLILVPSCDDVIETDGEILCNSVDSRDHYRLEADV